MACAAALSALPLARGSEDVRIGGARLAILALLALLAALVLGWSPFVPLSLALLGALYATQLRVDHEPLDSAVAVFAAGLIVTAELGYWSLEERVRVETERGEALRRLAFVALLGVGSALVAEVLLALADAIQVNGLGFEVMGAAAAAALLVTIAVLSRSQAGR